MSVVLEISSYYSRCVRTPSSLAALFRHLTLKQFAWFVIFLALRNTTCFSVSRGFALRNGQIEVRPGQQAVLLGIPYDRPVVGYGGRTINTLRLWKAGSAVGFNLGEFNFRVRHCPRTALPQLDRFTALDRQDPANVEYAAALKQVNSGRPRC